MSKNDQNIAKHVKKNDPNIAKNVKKIQKSSQLGVRFWYFWPGVA